MRTRGGSTGGSRPLALTAYGTEARLRALSLTGFKELRVHAVRPDLLHYSRPVQIPQVLHLTSARVPLAGFQRALFRRNRRVLDGWEFRVWSDADNDALVEEHFPEHVDKFRELPFGVMRADIARLVYMHAWGGWYADTDYEWLKAPHSSNAEVVLPKSRDDMLGNAVFGSRQGHPVWSMLIGRAMSNPDLTGAGVADIENYTGPGLLTAAWPSISEQTGISHPERELFHSPSDRPTPNSVGVHLTAGTWRDERFTWWAGRQVRRIRRVRNSFLRPRGR